MGIDRFGNPHASNLSYARGKILRSTEDDFQKLQRAWSLIRERGPGSTYVFTGLEHSLPLAAEELEKTWAGIIEATEQGFGRSDVMVANAGIGMLCKAVEMSLPDRRRKPR